MNLSLHFHRALIQADVPVLVRDMRLDIIKFSYEYSDAFPHEHLRFWRDGLLQKA